MEMWCRCNITRQYKASAIFASTMVAKDMQFDRNRNGNDTRLANNESCIVYPNTTGHLFNRQVVSLQCISSSLEILFADCGVYIVAKLKSHLNLRKCWMINVYSSSTLRDHISKSHVWTVKVMPSTIIMLAKPRPVQVSMQPTAWKADALHLRSMPAFDIRSFGKSVKTTIWIVYFYAKQGERRYIGIARIPIALKM